MKIDESVLRSAVSYDPITGEFTWLINVPGRWKIKAGDRAGSSLLSDCGKRYRRLCIAGQYMLEHRAAFIFMGCPLADDEEADHENGNGEDNSWLNLKRSTRKINAKNLRKREDNTSGVTGVSWDNSRNKWFVSINIDGKMKNLGRFDDFNEAVEARRQAEIENNFHKNHGSERPL